MKLSRKDFAEKYDNVSFNSSDVCVKIEDWDVNLELQRFVIHSSNCYFIRLDSDEAIIRIE